MASRRFSTLPPPPSTPRFSRLGDVLESFQILKNADWSLDHNVKIAVQSFRNWESMLEQLISSVSGDSNPLITMSILLRSTIFAPAPDVFELLVSQYLSSQPQESIRQPLAEILILWLHLFPLEFGERELYPRLNELYKKLKSTHVPSDGKLRHVVRHFYRVRREEKRFSFQYLAPFGQIPTNFDPVRLVSVFMASTPQDLATQLHHYELAHRLRISLSEFFDPTFTPLSSHSVQLHALHQHLRIWPHFLFRFLPGETPPENLLAILLEITHTLVFQFHNLSVGYALFSGIALLLSNVRFSNHHYTLKSQYRDISEVFQSVDSYQAHLRALGMSPFLHSPELMVPAVPVTMPSQWQLQLPKVSQFFSEVFIPRILLSPPPLLNQADHSLILCIFALLPCSLDLLKSNPFPSVPLMPSVQLPSCLHLNLVHIQQNTLGIFSLPSINSQARPNFDLHTSLNSLVSDGASEHRLSFCFLSPFLFSPQQTARFFAQMLAIYAKKPKMLGNLAQSFCLWYAYFLRTSAGILSNQHVLPLSTTLGPMFAQLDAEEQFPLTHLARSVENQISEFSLSVHGIHRAPSLALFEPTGPALPLLPETAVSLSQALFTTHARDIALHLTYWELAHRSRVSCFALLQPSLLLPLFENYQHIDAYLGAPSLYFPSFQSNLRHNYQVFRSFLWLVISLPDPRHRAQIIGHLIHIASDCLSWRNYQTSGTLTAMLETLIKSLPLTQSLVSDAAKAKFKKLRELFPLQSGLGIGPPSADYWNTVYDEMPTIPILSTFFIDIRMHLGSLKPLPLHPSAMAAPAKTTRKDSLLPFFRRTTRSKSDISALPPNTHPNYLVPGAMCSTLTNMIKIHLSSQFFSPSTWFGCPDVQVNPHIAASFRFISSSSSSLSDSFLGSTISDLTVSEFTQLNSPAQAPIINSEISLVVTSTSSSSEVSHPLGFTSFISAEDIREVDPHTPSIIEKQSHLAAVSRPFGFLESLEETDSPSSSASRPSRMPKFDLPMLGRLRTLSFAGSGPLSPETLLTARSASQHEMPLLIQAVIEGNADRLKELTSQHPATVYHSFSHESFAEMTLLHLACWKGKFALVPFLAERGASPLARTQPTAQLPLHLLAVQPTTSHSSQVIRAAFAAISQISDLFNPVGAQDFQGNTPLHLACAYRAYWSIKLLLAAKASITSQNRAHQTPIDILLAHNNLSDRYLRLLLSTRTSDSLSIGFIRSRILQANTNRRFLVAIDALEMSRISSPVVCYDAATHALRVPKPTDLFSSQWKYASINFVSENLLSLPGSHSWLARYLIFSQSIHSMDLLASLERMVQSFATPTDQDMLRVSFILHCWLDGQQFDNNSQTFCSGLIGQWLERLESTLASKGHAKASELAQQINTCRSPDRYSQTQKLLAIRTEKLRLFTESGSRSQKSSMLGSRANLLEQLAPAVLAQHLCAWAFFTTAAAPPYFFSSYAPRQLSSSNSSVSSLQSESLDRSDNSGSSEVEPQRVKTQMIHKAVAASSQTSVSAARSRPRKRSASFSGFSTRVNLSNQVPSHCTVLRASNSALRARISASGSSGQRFLEAEDFLVLRKHNQSLSGLGQRHGITAASSLISEAVGPDTSGDLSNLRVPILLSDSSQFSLPGYTMHAKIITHWVIVTILSESLLEVRVAFVRKFIKTACLCVEMSNLYMAAAIIAAFDHPAIKSLKVTLSSVGYEATEIMEELRKVCLSHSLSNRSLPDQYPFLASASRAQTELLRIQAEEGPDCVRKYLNVHRIMLFDQVFSSVLPPDFLHNPSRFDNTSLKAEVCTYLGTNCDIAQVNLFSEAVLRSIAERRQATEVKNTPMSILANARTENLSTVDLSAVRLSIMTPRLIQQLLVLTGLVDLNLSNNGLLELPYAISSLTRLEALDVSSNCLDSLPTSLSTMKLLKRLNIKHNPLDRIPEKFRQPKLILEHLQRALRMATVSTQSSSIRSTFTHSAMVSQSPPIRWPNLKICVLGEPGSGKSTLIHKFFEKYDPRNPRLKSSSRDDFLHHHRTLDISRLWIDSSQQLTFLEFNPAVQWLSLRPFFSRRSLYIIVVDLQNFSQDSIRSWLNQIALLGPPTPLVLIVATHLDCVPIDAAKEIMADIQKAFPAKQFIIGYQVFSSTTLFGLDQILQIISRALEHKIFASFASLPLSWWTLHRHLLQMTTSASPTPSPHISLTDFQLLALDSGVTEPPMEVLNFLADSGSVIFFDDSSSSLGELIVTDPSYIVSAMGTFFTIAPALLQNDFLLHFNAISGIFKNFPNFQDYLLALLYRLKLCFPVGTDAYLVPSILSDDCASNLPPLQTDVPRDIREYSRIFIFPSYPEGFFGELCINMLGLKELANLQDYTIWTTGFYLKCLPPDAVDGPLAQHAVVLFDPEVPSLTVTLLVMESTESDGLQKGGYFLLDWILESVQSLLDGAFSALKVNTRSIVPCPRCLTKVRLRYMLHSPLSYPVTHLIRDLPQSLERWVALNPLEQEGGPASQTPAAASNHSMLMVSSYIAFFTIDECASLFESDQQLVCNCPNENHRIPLRSLAPDLAFCDIFEIAVHSVKTDRIIGQGAFGQVSAGVYLPPAVKSDVVTIVPIALKELSVSNEPTVIQDFLHEILMMRGLDHPHIITCIGIVRKPLRIALEYCAGGDLGAVLHRPAKFPDQLLSKSLRLHLALNVVTGVEYLHTRVPAVVHRDLRTPNIFLSIPIPREELVRMSSSDSAASSSSLNPEQLLSEVLRSPAPHEKIVAKIGDFGLARRGQCSGLLASFRYLAPECINPAAGPYDESSDIYSLGMLFYELFTRVIPFDEFFDDPKFCRRLENDALVLNQQGLITAIISDNLRPTLPNNFPFDLMPLVHSCWKDDPHDRPTATEIRNQLEKLLASIRP